MTEVQAGPGFITEFTGPYRFLSSFYAGAPFEIPGIPGILQTREHAYQAAKAPTMAGAAWILSAPTPGEAKKRGRKTALAANWEQRKRMVMLQFMLYQYAQHPDLAQMLAATAPAVLVEGNSWGDTTWGAIPVSNAMIRGRGQGEPVLWKPDPQDPCTWLAGDNWLGRTLMMAREVLS